MKKIKVGFDVTPLYSGDKVRGIGFYTQRLLAELKKIKAIEIVEIKNKNERKKANYEILHIPYFRPFFATLPWRKWHPWVITVHDLIPLKYPQHYPPGWRGRLKWWRQKYLLRRADFIITDSFTAKYDISRLAGYPQDRIYVTYLAADAHFHPLKNNKKLNQVRDKYCLPPKFVLYVGDVNWNKNIPGLVKASRRVGLDLVIVGKQALAKNFVRRHPENQPLVWLQRQAKKDKHLHLLGFVPTVDLVALYNLATMYCQPSFDEGFGLPVIEAMASGCPVVASRRGSLPEVVKDAGILVEPDVSSLSQGIAMLLKDAGLRQRLVRRGRQRAREFSWKKTAMATLLVYKLAAGVV